MTVIPETGTKFDIYVFICTVIHIDMQLEQAYGAFINYHNEMSIGLDNYVFTTLQQRSLIAEYFYGRN